MKQIFRALRSFARRDEGGVLIMIALSLLVICALVGASLDFGRAYLVKMKFQQATDAAALAAANLPGGNTDVATKIATADRYYKLNFPASYLGVTRPAAQINVDAASGSVSVGAGENVSTSFTGLVGTNTLRVNAYSEVPKDEHPEVDADVVLLVDETASTACPLEQGRVCSASDPQAESISILRAEKNAAKAMLDTLFASGTDTSKLRFGLIGYSGAVTHAYSLTSDTNTAKNWVETLAFYHNNYDVYGLRAASNMLTPSAWSHYQPSANCPKNTYVAYQSGVFNPCTPQENTAVDAPNTNRADGTLVSRNKVVVFITDGDVMYDYGGRCYYDSTNGDVCNGSPIQYADLSTECNKLKADGVLMYVINFKKFDTAAQDVLKNCASAPNAPYYLYAPDQVALQNALVGIARTVRKIRITH